MANTLIFPDGVRLTARDEIPGPENVREEIWARVERANIAPGFVVRTASDPRFQYYAEANVDAPMIWLVFRDLSVNLLASEGALLLAFKDDEAQTIAEAKVASILEVLEPHAYQLQHDGYMHFGIVSQTDEELAEVFVADTKYFKVWFSDLPAFKAIMARYGLAEAGRLEFIDQYAHVTTRLPPEKGVWRVDELALHLTDRLQGTPAS